jgi:hypothetical protein
MVGLTKTVISHGWMNNEISIRDIKANVANVIEIEPRGDSGLRHPDEALPAPLSMAQPRPERCRAGAKDLNETLFSNALKHIDDLYVEWVKAVILYLGGSPARLHCTRVNQFGESKGSGIGSPQIGGESASLYRTDMLPATQMWPASILVR